MITNARGYFNGAEFQLAPLAQQLQSENLVEQAKSAAPFGQQRTIPRCGGMRHVSPGNRPVINVVVNGLEEMPDQNLLLMPHVAREHETHVKADLVNGETTIVTPGDGSVIERMLAKHALSRRVEHLYAPKLREASYAAVVASGMHLDVVAVGLAGLMASLAVFGMERNGQPRQVVPINASESVLAATATTREAEYCITDTSTLAKIFNNNAAVGRGATLRDPGYVPVYVPDADKIEAMSVFASLSRQDGQPFFRETKSVYSALSGIPVRVIVAVEGGGLSSQLPNLSGESLELGIASALAILEFNGYPMNRLWGHYNTFLHNTPVYGGLSDYRTLSSMPMVRAGPVHNVYPHNVGPGGDRAQAPDVDGAALPDADQPGEMTQQQINAAVQNDLGASAAVDDAHNRLIFATYNRNGYGAPMPTGQDAWYVVQVERLSLAELGYFIACNNRDTTVHDPQGNYLVPRFEAWRDEDGNGVANAPNNADVAGPAFARNGQANIGSYPFLTFIPEFGRSRVLLVMDDRDPNYPHLGGNGLVAVDEFEWDNFLQEDGVHASSDVFPYPDYSGLANYDEDHVFLHAITDYAAFRNWWRGAGAGVPLLWYRLTQNNLGRDAMPELVDGEDLPLRFDDKFEPDLVTTLRINVGDANQGYAWPRVIKNKCFSDEASCSRAFQRNAVFNNLLRNSIEMVHPNRQNGGMLTGAQRFSVVQVWAYIYAWTRWADWQNSLRYELHKQFLPPQPYAYASGRHCHYVGGAFAITEVKVFTGIWTLAFTPAVSEGMGIPRVTTAMDFQSMAMPDVVAQTILTLRSAADLAMQFLRASRLTLEGRGGKYYNSIPDVIRRHAMRNPGILRRVPLYDAQVLPHLIVTICGQMRSHAGLVIAPSSEARLYPSEVPYRYVADPMANLQDEGNHGRMSIIPQLTTNDHIISSLTVTPLTGQMVPEATQWLTGLVNVDGAIVMEKVPDLPVSTTTLVNDLLVGVASTAERAIIGYGWGERRILHNFFALNALRSNYGTVFEGALDEEDMLQFALPYMMVSPPYYLQMTDLRCGETDWYPDLAANAQNFGMPADRDPGMWDRALPCYSVPDTVNRVDFTLSFGPRAAESKRLSVFDASTLPNSTAAVVTQLMRGVFPAPRVDEYPVDLATANNVEPTLTPEQENVAVGDVADAGVGQRGAAEVGLPPDVYAAMLRALSAQGQDAVDAFTSTYSVLANNTAPAAVAGDDADEDQ